MTWVVLSVPVSLLLGLSIRARNRDEVLPGLPRDGVGGYGVSGGFETPPASAPVRMMRDAVVQSERARVAVQARASDGRAGEGMVF